MVSRRCPHYPGPRSSPPVRERAHILKPQFASPRAFARALAAALALLAGGAATASAADPVDATIDLSAPAPEASPQVEQAQAQLRDSLGARGLVEPDPDTGSPKLVARLNGFLTAGEHERPRRRRARLRRAAPRRLRPGGGGPRRLPGDLPHDRGRRDHVPELGAADGRDPERRRRPEGRGQRRRAADQRDRRPARRAGRRDVHAGDRRAARVRGRDAGRRAGAAGDRRQRSPTGGRGSCSSGEASLVRFRDGDEDRLGWRVLAPEGSQAFYDAIVDARTGKLIRRVNRVRSAAQIRHFDVSPRAEPVSSTLRERAGGLARRVGDDAQRAVRPRGLRPHRPHQGRPERVDATRSSGPVAADEVAPTARAAPTRSGTSRRSSTSAARAALLLGRPPTAPRTGQFSTAQLFWYANTFRDHLAAAPIGFSGSEAFAGNDPVIAQSLDGASTGPGRRAPLEREHARAAERLPGPDADVPVRRAGDRSAATTARWTRRWSTTSTRTGSASASSPTRRASAP